MSRRVLAIAATTLYAALALSAPAGADTTTTTTPPTTPAITEIQGDADGFNPGLMAMCAGILPLAVVGIGTRRVLRAARGNF